MAVAIGEAHCVSFAIVRECYLPFEWLWLWRRCIFGMRSHQKRSHSRSPALLNFSKHTKLCICDSLNYTMLSLSSSSPTKLYCMRPLKRTTIVWMCALAMVTLVLLRLLHIYYCHVVCHVIFVMGGRVARVATAQTAFSIQCCRMKSFPCCCYTVAKRG